MAANEKTSLRIAKLAAIGVHHPGLLSSAEISAVCASALTQAADRKKPRQRRKVSKK